jgi:predicted secreted Zn-dependent protease
VSGAEPDVTLDAAPVDAPRQLPTVASVQTLPAEPLRVRLTAVNTFYDVEGTDVRSLLVSLRQRGPRDDAGAWAASTTWTFVWSYQPLLADGCRAEGATVDLHVTFTYPRWARSSEVAQPVVDAWARYLANVETHEQGHAELARAAASDLVQAIEATPAQPTCDNLAPAVNAAANEMLQRHAQAQLAYDRETQHGVAQGATLSLSR